MLQTYQHTFATPPTPYFAITCGSWHGLTAPGVNRFPLTSHLIGSYFGVKGAFLSPAPILLAESVLEESPGEPPRLFRVEPCVDERFVGIVRVFGKVLEVGIALRTFQFSLGIREFPLEIFKFSLLVSCPPVDSF